MTVLAHHLYTRPQHYSFLLKTDTTSTSKADFKDAPSPSAMLAQQSNLCAPHDAPCCLLPHAPSLPQAHPYCSLPAQGSRFLQRSQMMLLQLASAMQQKFQNFNVSRDCSIPDKSGVGAPPAKPVVDKQINPFGSSKSLHSFSLA